METATTTATTKTKKPPPAVPSLANGPTPIVLSIPIGDIDESPTNPRITFRGVEELAANIKEHGVLQPGTARPSPRGDAGVGRYELVFAARRLRAAKLAGLTEFPLMVRGLTDEQVLEMQLAENGNREDVHPLEEADGYRRGIEVHGWTTEEIAAKFGKDVGTVRKRLQYCSLIPAAREAFLAGELSGETALIVARITSHGVQQRALKEILTYSGREPGDPPTSKRDASWIVTTKFMLRLVDAPFDRKDANLVAGTPACGDCPKRTGKQRELFDDVDKKDDLCTDLACFALKRDAAWEKKRAAAETKGQAVLPEKESKKVFYGQTLRHDSEYVDLEATHYAGGVGKGVAFKTLLPKKADVPVIIARDEEGHVHELVSKKVFAKLAPKAGIRAPDADKASAAASKRYYEKTVADRAARLNALRSDAAQIAEKAESYQPSDAFWRTLARAVARDRDMMDPVSTDAVARSLGIDVEKSGRVMDVLEDDVLPAIAKLKGARARGLVVEMLCGDEHTPKETLEEFRELYGMKTKAKPKPKKKAAAKKKARS